MNESSVRTEHLPGGPDLERILREHAYRGAYLQLTVRGALVLFIALTLIFVPPMNDAGWCFAILGRPMPSGRQPWRCGSARAAPAPVTMIWLGLFVDLAVLATLTLLTGLRSRAELDRRHLEQRALRHSGSCVYATTADGRVCRRRCLHDRGVLRFQLGNDDFELRGRGRRSC